GAYRLVLGIYCRFFQFHQRGKVLNEGGRACSCILLGPRTSLSLTRIHLITVTLIMTANILFYVHFVISVLGSCYNHVIQQKIAVQSSVAIWSLLSALFQ
uniref:Uncharacterized protein n=1 Tax=Gasterosteus aculeatus TaxID=69293 RepID=G3NYV8_GASAC